MSLTNHIFPFGLQWVPYFFQIWGFAFFGGRLGFSQNGCLTTVDTGPLRFVRNSSKWKHCTGSEREDYREETLGRDRD